MTTYRCKVCNYECGDESICPECGADWEQENSLIVEE